MGIAQSRLGCLREDFKSKLKHDHCKVDSQKKDCRDASEEEDGTDDSQNEDIIDDSQVEYCTDEICNKNDDSSLFYGTHETQVSEGGEADLHKHVVSCKKNPGHKKFVPVNDFNIKHLPIDHHDNKLVQFIKAKADLTVRIDVTVTSTKRPAFWPNTEKPYPFYDKRGNVVMRLGTGMVRYVNTRTGENIQKCNKETCKCPKCQHWDTPSKVWGEVRMYTARHVVFDDFEARKTTCRLFYDRQDSPLVTLKGWKVFRANTAGDWCLLKCVTCDVDLLDKLDTMARHVFHLWKKVTNKYMSSRDETTLSFIVSHPHGCPKQISLGYLIKRYELSDYKTKYTYTTCTCPGSSGARVHSLGDVGWLYYYRHVHSGVNSEGINVSGTGRGLPTIDNLNNVKII